MHTTIRICGGSKSSSNMRANNSNNCLNSWSTCDSEDIAACSESVSGTAFNVGVDLGRTHFIYGEFGDHSAEGGGVVRHFIQVTATGNSKIAIWYTLDMATGARKQCSFNFSKVRQIGKH